MHLTYCHWFFFCLLISIYVACVSFWLQGARRIVSEWPDLDLEARQFTAKILGDEVAIQESAPVLNQPGTSVMDSPPLNDLESRAEL